MKKLETFTVEELVNKELKPMKYVVDKLIPPGLSIFAGLGKIGKSWLIYWLIIQIAKGEKVWGFDTTRVTTLYLAFEDSENRLQDRFFMLFDDVEEAPENAYLCIENFKIGGELEERIKNFILKYPDTNLIVIDTLQKIRDGKESSYANDYEDVTMIKNIADEFKIAIILVHHTRKMKDKDIFNEISGSTGLQGACDNMFVLTQSKRGGNYAKLNCVGRDIPQREIELERREDFVWEMLSDSESETTLEEKRIIETLKKLVYEKGDLKTNPTELSTLINENSGDKISAKMISRKLKSIKPNLEKADIHCIFRKSNGQRIIELSSKRGESVEKIRW